MSWVSLFSGGKDSAYAYYLAEQAGLSVDRLLTVHPDTDSYLYHVPATELTALAADSIGIPIRDVQLPDSAEEAPPDATTRGDAELQPLETELRELRTADDLTGVVAGAIESEYQASRLQDLCDRLAIRLYTPLWQAEPRPLLEDMVAAGFEIVVVQVAADGLDESWLGRTLDTDAIEALAQLADEHGIHILGEGGEFETLVVDGPHMDHRIALEYDTVWDGVRGHLTIREATLA